MKNSQIIILDERTDTSEQLKKDIISLDYQKVDILKDTEDIKELIKNNFVNLIFVPVEACELKNIRIVEKILYTIDIPVVYTTSYITNELKQKSEHTNPAGYLETNYEKKHLNGMIKLALSRYIPHLP